MERRNKDFHFQALIISECPKRIKSREEIRSSFLPIYCTPVKDHISYGIFPLTLTMHHSCRYYFYPPIRKARKSASIRRMLKVGSRKVTWCKGLGSRKRKEKIGWLLLNKMGVAQRMWNNWYWVSVCLIEHGENVALIHFCGFVRLLIK